MAQIAVVGLGGVRRHTAPLFGRFFAKLAALKAQLEEEAKERR